MWRLNMLLNNQWLNEEINKHRKTNENVNTIYHNLSDAAKAVLRTFMAVQAYLKKQEKSQSNFTPKVNRTRTSRVQSQWKDRNNKSQSGNS